LSGFAAETRLLTESVQVQIDLSLPHNLLSGMLFGTIRSVQPNNLVVAGVVTTVVANVIFLTDPGRIGALESWLAYAAGVGWGMALLLPARWRRWTIAYMAIATPLGLVFALLLIRALPA
jgi:hypothetical protein